MTTFVDKQNTQYSYTTLASPITLQINHKCVYLIFHEQHMWKKKQFPRWSNWMRIRLAMYIMQCMHTELVCAHHQNPAAPMEVQDGRIGAHELVFSHSRMYFNDMKQFEFMNCIFMDFHQSGFIGAMCVCIYANPIMGMHILSTRKTHTRNSSKCML